MTEIERISMLLENTFEGSAWHGPAVMDALADITPEISMHRIGKTHSIVELVMHMTSWRKFVTEKLKGNTLYDVSPEQNFPKPSPWAQALTNLKTSQRELMDALKTFPEPRLNDIVPTRKYNFYSMLQGIIQHDIYHTGQIMMIKRSLGNR